MKKTLIWVIAIIIIVLLGLYFWGGNSASQTSTSTDQNATTTTTDIVDGTNEGATSSASGSTSASTTGMKSTLGGIFDNPGSYECDYNQLSGTPGNSVRSTNVIYIANGRLRGEFRTTSATSTVLSMMVYDGNNLYVWNEGQSAGKVSVPKTIKDLPGVIPEDITSGRILGNSQINVSWDCHAWSTDPAKLVKPSYVTFK
jgi:hypothetical protein